MLPALAIVAAVVAAPLLYAATRPDTFRVQRAARIRARPEAIFPHLADFRRWEAWSPWEKMDPAMTRTHGGAERGVGAVYAWEGNKKVGKGRMEITAAAAPERLVIQLDFIAPFAASNVTEFRLDPADGDTVVTWTMQGKSAYMMKVMGVFMSMDRMVGKDFEAGLANLKEVAERDAGALPA